jgi:hypothetical protein
MLKRICFKRRIGSKPELLDIYMLLNWFLMSLIDDDGHYSMCYPCGFGS